MADPEGPQPVSIVAAARTGKQSELQARFTLQPAGTTGYQQTITINSPGRERAWIINDIRVYCDSDKIQLHAQGMQDQEPHTPVIDLNFISFGLECVRLLQPAVIDGESQVYVFTNLSVMPQDVSVLIATALTSAEVARSYRAERNRERGIS